MFFGTTAATILRRVLQYSKIWTDTFTLLVYCWIREFLLRRWSSSSIFWLVRILEGGVDIVLSIKVHAYVYSGGMMTRQLTSLH